MGTDLIKMEQIVTRHVKVDVLWLEHELINRLSMIWTGPIRATSYMIQSSLAIGH